MPALFWSSLIYKVYGLSDANPIVFPWWSWEEEFTLLWWLDVVFYFGLLHLEATSFLFCSFFFLSVLDSIARYQGVFQKVSYSLILVYTDFKDKIWNFDS